MNNQESKHQAEELARYRALALAAIDYQIQLYENSPLPGFNPLPSLENQKKQIEEHFAKGRLTVLKRWYRNLTEGIRESRELKFNSFAKERTGYTIDIFKEHFDRVEKYIAKGKLITDNQFYDVISTVDYLSQIQPLEENKIAVLNRLLTDYQQKKNKRT